MLQMESISLTTDENLQNGTENDTNAPMHPKNRDDLNILLFRAANEEKDRPNLNYHIQDLSSEQRVHRIRAFTLKSEKAVPSLLTAKK